jgi:eukaryotic-like serine/threonine-protein kinase
MFGSPKKANPDELTNETIEPHRVDFSAAPDAQAKAKRVNLDRRFQIVAEIGSGSMSKVYRATDMMNSRSVCLKVQDTRKTAAAVARVDSTVFRPSEGAVGVRITHPNVVKTFEHGESTKGEHYIVMEFIEGVSLTYVRQSRPFDLESRIELLAQAADGLAAVHAARFIHHDFGPKNLLVDRFDQVKLIDFGLTVPNTPAFRRPGNRTGTLYYMAPELLRRESTDERIDIFSWGVTAFELLTGKMPYDSKGDPMVQMRLRINNDPMDIAKANPKLPPELCDLIRSTLARRPDERWPKIATMGEALREILGTASGIAEADFTEEPEEIPAVENLDEDDSAEHNVRRDKRRDDDVDDFLALFEP